MKTTCPKCKRRIRIRKGKRDLKCPCGFELSHRKFFGSSNVYLIDTNIFLYAVNNDRHYGDACVTLLSVGGELATTNHVVDEIRQSCRHSVRVYNVDKISPEVAELRYGDESRELSLADRSLIQCAIDHPEIGGIITYDIDIKSVVPSRLIKSEKPFYVMTAEQFLKKSNKGRFK
jgi:rRNA-processing protein FCF1